MIEEVQKVIEAVNDVRGIEDPLRRARAISELLKAQAAGESELREERRQIVLALRAQKPPVSLRKIAEQLGVSLGTVQDIVRGHSGAWGTKPRKKPSDE